MTLDFDNKTGALSQILCGGVSWASATNTLFAFEYQSYNISQFQAFQRAYSNLTNPPGYFPHDFGKPNDVEAVNYVAQARALSFWIKRSDTGATILIESHFELAQLHEEYGAPSSMWTQLDVDDDRINVTVTLANKSATRHAEALFLRLKPRQATIEMDKLGSWIQMTKGLVVDGGNKQMHAVNRGIRFNQSDGSSMVLETLDAGVVAFGSPTGFPISGPYGNAEPDLSQGVSSMLFNNLWGTVIINHDPCSIKFISEHLLK